MTYHHPNIEAQPYREITEAQYDAELALADATGFARGKAEGLQAAEKPMPKPVISRRRKGSAFLAGCLVLAGAGYEGWFWHNVEMQQASTVAHAEGLTQGLRDHQSAIRTAGREDGRRAGDAAGFARGQKQGSSEGYQQGASAMENTLKPLALNLIVAANQRAEKAEHDRAEFRQRALRVFTHLQKRPVNTKPCFQEDGVDIRFLFGAGFKVGSSKPANCKL